MAHLITEPNMPAPDDFYADLIAAHTGLSDDESEAFNARLILVLANHIGNQTILREALEASK
ncbi:MAG: DUF2783 domain-containing protein [Pseudomonadota bacterium]